VFVSSIEARQPRAAVDRRCSSVLARTRKATRPSHLKEHSTLKSLCRGTKNRLDLARHEPSSRAAIWYRLCEAKQRTLFRTAAAHNRYPALQLHFLLQSLMTAHNRRLPHARLDTFLEYDHLPFHCGSLVNFLTD
jgi:hypothetical protein